MKLLTTIPFIGFYETIHGDAYSQTIERMFSDDTTGCHEFCNVDADKVHDAMDSTYFNKKYAEAYVENFAEENEIELEFESLVSPKFYNFETDRIFAYVDSAVVDKLLNKHWDGLCRYIHNEFSHSNGFMSHYSNCIDDWPEKIEEWDHNQIGTILEYLFACDDDIDMSNYSGNGYFDEWALHGNKKLIDLVDRHDRIESAKKKKAA